MNEEQILEGFILIFFTGITAQVVGWKLRFPSVIILLIAGVLLGPVFNLIPSEILNDSFLHTALKLSLALILFEGGLQLKFHELKESGTIVKRMTTVGAIFNFILSTLATHYVLGLSWAISLIVGSILIVTGPTVILPLLKDARLPKRISSGLKWEGIIVDPIGAIITVLIFEFFAFYDNVPGQFWLLLKSLLLSLLVSAALAYISSKFIKYVIEHFHLSEHLKVPFIISIVLLVYHLSNLVQHEAGLMTTTLLGIILGNMRVSFLEELHKFKETMTVMLLSLIFIFLAGTLQFDDLKKIAEPNFIGYIALVIFVIRPLAIHLSLIKTDLNFKERTFLGWIGPRGVVAAAVTDVFAPKLIDLGFIEADLLVPLMFAIIFSTVIIHGLTLGPLAKKLIPMEAPQGGILIIGATPWGIQLASTLKKINFPVTISDDSWEKLRSAKMQGIDTYYGQILSELSEESLDLTNFSTILACTPNDSYNALVCTHFIGKFGRSNVYQLALHDLNDHNEKGLKANLRGQIIISGDAFHEVLEKYHYQGWSFQSTHLTDEFDFNSLTESIGETSMLLLSIGAGNRIRFHKVSGAFKPKIGDVVLSYVPPSVASHT